MSGRYHSQAIAMTTGATIAVRISETMPAPAASMLPMNGTTSATTTSGLRISMKPRNIAMTPHEPKDPGHDAVLALRRVEHVGGGVIPGRTISRRSPAWVW